MAKEISRNKSIPMRDISEEEFADILGKGIIARYSISIPAIIILYFFRNQLPFPCPGLLLVSSAHVICNIVIHICSKQRYLLKASYYTALYIDSIASAFVFEFSGGFLSPFIIPNYLSSLAAGIIYKRKDNFGRNNFTIVLGAYVIVSLLQKLGVLPNDVAYSEILMKNNVFFYFVLVTISISFANGYNVLNNHMKWRVSETTDAYKKMVAGITGQIGDEFLKALAHSLSLVSDMPGVMIAKLTNNNMVLNTISIRYENITYDNLEIPVKESPFNKIIFKKNEFFCKKNVKVFFPASSTIPAFEKATLIGVPLVNSHGEPLGLLSLWGPIKIQNELLISQILKLYASRASAELERSIMEQEKEKMRAEMMQMQKMEAVGKIASSVAHDFNNFLGAIQGYTELIHHSILNQPELSGYLKKIIHNVERAANLARQLLTFSGKSRLEKVDVNIHLLVKEAIFVLKGMVDNKIKVNCTISSTNSNIKGESTHLYSALLNLGTNAKDAMPDGGALSFEVDDFTLAENTTSPFIGKGMVPGEYIRITVTDTGTGMDKETLARATEPFFTTKKIGAGTGLGLASVSGCVHSHGGILNIESEVGKGTAITIYLPASQKAVAPAKILSVPQKTNEIKQLQILLVDDEEDVVTPLAENLKTYGFVTHVFTSALKAMEFYRGSYRSIDIVMLDMIMPEMNGKELFIAMRAIDPKIKICIVSGYSSESDIKTLNDLGVFAFLHKPVSADIIKKTVLQILGN